MNILWIVIIVVLRLSVNQMFIIFNKLNENKKNMFLHRNISLTDIGNRYLYSIPIEYSGPINKIVF